MTISPAHRAGTRVIRAMAPDRSVLALERRLDHCRRDHPDLDFRSIATHSNVLNYPEHLKRTAPRIQLVVVDPLRPARAISCWGRPAAQRLTPPVAPC
ncbi:hypothetical protein I553_9442 [Mycobacterium xenopi 4042]|uniref:Uncharacterized protein n=1 Tax=Mycobacterium xenopi 4042 TaxID=1299334 RepID=X8DZB2_MYCXE|nr:hypothetical protein I553_9442 [Mycobacterium xenopi 4042]